MHSLANVILCSLSPPICTLAIVVRVHCYHHIRSCRTKATLKPPASYMFVWNHTYESKLLGTRKWKSCVGIQTRKVHTHLGGVWKFEPAFKYLRICSKQLRQQQQHPVTARVTAWISQCWLLQPPPAIQSEPRIFWASDVCVLVIFLFHLPGSNSMFFVHHRRQTDIKTGRQVDSLSI